MRGEGAVVPAHSAIAQAQHYSGAIRLSQREHLTTRGRGVWLTSVGAEPVLGADAVQVRGVAVRLSCPRRRRRWLLRREAIRSPPPEVRPAETPPVGWRARLGVPALRVGILLLIAALRVA